VFDGGTAGGSSGSPIFDNNKRIVGQLTGGSGGDCGNGTDYYGKFSKSWNNSGSSSGNLKAWLDPGNTSVNTLNGTYDGASIVYGCTDGNACNYESGATNDDGSCTYAQGTCDCNGNPTGYYCNCSGNVNDECGVCGGSGIPSGECDCAGNVDIGCGCGETGPSGCNDVCGSTLEDDDCGVCGGPGTNIECWDGSVVCEVSDCSIQSTLLPITYSGDLDRTIRNFTYHRAIPTFYIGTRATTDTTIIIL
jgi:hypothetical protein